jgi:cell division protein FtsI/penicillin-binding protein 2
MGGDNLNSVIDLLKNRVSLRKYDSREISKEHLDLILESAMRAPTAGNLMLYSIIVIKDKKKKEILAKTCDNQPFIASAPVVLIFAADYQKTFDYYKLNGVKEFGIGEKLPFAMSLTPSQLGNLEKEVELADSGYGQDKVLMNPLHLALIYSSFVNDGNILTPVLETKDKTDAPKPWKEKVISKEIADLIVKDLTQVVHRITGLRQSLKWHSSCNIRI